MVEVAVVGNRTQCLIARWTTGGSARSPRKEMFEEDWAAGSLRPTPSLNHLCPIPPSNWYLGLQIVVLLIFWGLLRPCLFLLLFINSADTFIKRKVKWMDLKHVIPLVVGVQRTLERGRLWGSQSTLGFKPTTIGLKRQRTPQLFRPRYDIISILNRGKEDPRCKDCIT